jgi:predicted peptidase
MCATGLASEYLIAVPSRRRTGAWPLIVFLHGSDERGQDTARLRSCGPFALSGTNLGFPAIIAAPQCLPDEDWEPDSLAAFVELVASSYQVDRNRIYLIGYSMGGYGTWRTAARYPDLFAAIVPIGGGGDANDAESLASIPVWAFHGANDNVIPLEESERMIEAIQAAGGKPILTVLPDAGHGICEEVCRRSDLWEWLLRQCRSGDGHP